LASYAWQSGHVPVSLDALNRALELNGVAIEANKRAFGCGRLAAHDRRWFDEVTAPPLHVIQMQMPVSLDKLIERRASFLVQYQGETYARLYTDFVGLVKKRESSVQAGSTRLPLTEAVARSLFKLMSYKDEYEVARLHTDPQFLKTIHEQFEGDFKLAFNLAPPMLSKRNAKGELQKSQYGSWILGAFKLLARLKKVRGTPLDIFGYTVERKMERTLIDEYRVLIQEVLGHLSASNLPLAAEIARLPQLVRGYGHVKERQVVVYRARLEELRLKFFG
jgi:indolepyruvate ferredoxin oxidoreductase